MSLQSAGRSSVARRARRSRSRRPGAPRSSSRSWRSRRRSPLFERFTARARRVVVHAQDEARTLGHNYVGTEHLLLGVLSDPEGSAAQVLSAHGIDFSAAHAWVERNVGRGSFGAVRDLAFSVRGKTAVELSMGEANALGHDEVDSEHVLIALTRVEDGLALRLMVELAAPERPARAPEAANLVASAI